MTGTEQPAGTQQAREMASDPYSHSYPSRGLLRPLGDLWIVFVIGALHEVGQSWRFKGTSARVDGISTKILTQTLRGPEYDRPIECRQYPEILPRVTYELIGSGKELVETLSHIEAWATEHLSAVNQTRARYDAEH